MQAELIVSGLLNIVRILAVVALLLVCLMIINTVTTVLSEQIRIIGTMKALGGTRWQIMSSYLLSVEIYGISRDGAGHCRRLIHLCGGCLVS